MRKRTRLSYDATDDRWVVQWGSRWYGLRCGESFGLQIGSSVVGCRLERDSHWYVILTDATTFILHPRAVYTVSVDT